MGESKNVGLAAALAGGYALGRSKKSGMALTAAALLAAKGLSPRNVVSGGIRKLPGVPAKKSEEPEKSEDGQHRSLLTRAVRGAASSAANRPLTALTDALHERTLGLNGEQDPDRDSADTDDVDFEEDEGADSQVEEDSEETAQKPPVKSRRRPAPTKRNSGREHPKSAAKRAAPRKPAASRKQAAAAKRPERNPASTKRTASGGEQPTKKSTSRSRRER